MFEKLFPLKSKRIEEQEAEIQELNKLIDELEGTQPSAYVREMLGGTMIDFVDFQVDRHDGLTDEEKKFRNAQLALLHQNSELNNLFKYWINMFGNHTVREATIDDFHLGRFSINGIMKIKSDIEEGYNEHMQNSQPKEAFDEHAVGVSLEEIIK